MGTCKLKGSELDYFWKNMFFPNIWWLAYAVILGWYYKNSNSASDKEVCGGWWRARFKGIIS